MMKQVPENQKYLLAMRALANASFLVIPNYNIASKGYDWTRGQLSIAESIASILKDRPDNDPINCWMSRK